MLFLSKLILFLSLFQNPTNISARTELIMSAILPPKNADSDMGEDSDDPENIILSKYGNYLDSEESSEAPSLTPSLEDLLKEVDEGNSFDFNYQSFEAEKITCSSEPMTETSSITDDSVLPVLVNLEPVSLNGHNSNVPHAYGSEKLDVGESLIVVPPEIIDQNLEEEINSVSSVVSPETTEKVEAINNSQKIRKRRVRPLPAVVLKKPKINSKQKKNLI